MTSLKINESMVEEITLAWFEGLGYRVISGSKIAPGEPESERESYEDVYLALRLKEAISRLNPDIPMNAQEEAYRRVTRLSLPSLVRNNHAFHKILVEGVDVEYLSDDRVIHEKVRIIDFFEPENNDWLVVNQFTVVDGEYTRRPDIVVFVNGLPLIVIELKNPSNELATIWSAFNQLQTYKDQISSLFVFNEILVVSDGLNARYGSITADREWFLTWRLTNSSEMITNSTLELENIIKGMFDKNCFLRLVRHFIVFEEDNRGILRKKIAGNHQFQAVENAVATTLSASLPDGDRKCGVVWHTQGSGKSLTMVFFAGRIILESAMENPTLVVITDRNDLDNQLFETFSQCHEILRQRPVQAEDRAHLREILSVAAGGIVFTTIQKFFPSKNSREFPCLSQRKNIVVIADEAHRSQYDFIDGFARHMRDALPNASFIGFTATPIELADRNTRAIFGDYISVYDIQQAVEDGATVPIYYESRLIDLDLDKAERPHLDNEFEEITEQEEPELREKLKTKWAALETVVGSEKRLRLLAEDILNHFQKRLEAIDGKAMIVCMSRRTCVNLYSEITRLQPDWHSLDDMHGNIKLVITGSASDPLDWQQHIRSKNRRDTIARRFKNPEDSLKIVIVCDMWLTGFDVPCLHTMYVDKPMKGHSLMQAIARVNRVFKDKPGGLVVDYLGLAHQLKHALATYIASGGRGLTAIDQEEAVSVLHEKYEICCGLFYGYDWTNWRASGPEERLRMLPEAQEHILSQNDGKRRYLQAVSDLSKAFALATPHKKALKIRDDVAFFQTVRAALVKSGAPGRDSTESLEYAIRQLISKAITPDKVMDIFSLAGLKKPDISILSDEFLSEVRGIPQTNLAVEILYRLLNDEIKSKSRKNIVQARSFSKMLEKTINAYRNRAIETKLIIDELIILAKEMRKSHLRGEKLGLTEEEIAFYDALETNDSAVKILGDETLKTIARELAETVRRNATIDWTIRESIRAKMRIMVKRVLRKYGYPPDKQEKATIIVLEQAEVLCEAWTI